jgi:HK97 gp10 family phage protein
MTVTIPEVIRDAAKRALVKGAEELVAEMRRMAPEKDGHLKRSINWTFGNAPKGALAIDTLGAKGSSLRITIYAGGPTLTKKIRKDTAGFVKRLSRRIGVVGAIPDYDYAFAQEFGTKHMAPNPFFYTSYRKLKRRIKSRITREINKAIRSL